MVVAERHGTGGVSAYYNENDAFAAQWLRNLIAAGHIAPGEVDERDIRLVRPDDLRGFAQCHFFAGIGVWSHALRLAGWPDDRAVWTGSCPCQPFSTAGKGEGTADPRHLWPEWFRLICECRPVAVFGEQVSAAIRHGWLDLVSADLEGLDYACGAAVLGAHSVGAPHIRQRLYFVAESGCERLEGQQVRLQPRQARFDHAEASGSGRTGELADLHGSRRGAGRAGEARDGGDAARVEPSGFRAAGVVGNTDNARSQGRRLLGTVDGGAGDGQRLARQAGSSFWSDAEWLPCIDGKARPVEPGTFPLAHWAAARVGRLRAYGNAIVAPQAAEFIKAYMT